MPRLLGHTPPLNNPILNREFGAFSLNYRTFKVKICRQKQLQTFVFRLFDTRMWFSLNDIGVDDKQGMTMETEITVKIAKGADGFYIARAVGYPGVMTYGQSVEEVTSEIGIIWQTMQEINEVRQVGNRNYPIYRGAPNVRLQVA